METTKSLIPLHPNYVTFDELRPGRPNHQIICRLLRSWFSSAVTSEAKAPDIVLILLDEKNSAIQALIPPPQGRKYQHLLQDGFIYKISGFEVGRSNNLYQVTDHNFLIRFLHLTTMEQLAHHIPAIKQYKFMLRTPDRLYAIANTDYELPDVVGQICHIQGSHLCDPTSTLRLVVRLRLNKCVLAYLTLWDHAAASFRAHLNTSTTGNSVMVVTSINPKLFAGSLYLNSTNGTRFIFDHTIHSIQQLLKSFEIEANAPYTRADTTAAVHKMETVSISELYDYVSKTTQQTQDADFLCKATVVDILKQNGCSFTSCYTSTRELHNSTKNPRCNDSASHSLPGIVRYSVQLTVHDGSDSATFVLSHSSITELTSNSIATVPGEVERYGNNAFQLPTRVQELVGRQFFFQLKVTPTNHTPTQQTFAATSITPANTCGNGVKGHAKFIDTTVNRIMEQSPSTDAILLDM